MKTLMTIEEFEKQLKNRRVCDVLDDLTRIFKTWNKGGALIHRVRGAGYLAETGARNIREGRTPIKADSTFEDMQALDKKMYSQTIEFLYPAAKYGIYSP